MTTTKLQPGQIYTDPAVVRRLLDDMQKLTDIAQVMALQLAGFAVVFDAENQKFEHPLPLDPLKDVLKQWNEYTETKKLEIVA